MKDFRVKFRLPDEIAGIFDSVTDKPRYISRAIEWYVTHGNKIDERLARIESMLVNGSGNPVVKKEDAEENEIDDAFSDFVL